MLQITSPKEAETNSCICILHTVVNSTRSVLITQLAMFIKRYPGTGDRKLYLVVTGKDILRPVSEIHYDSESRTYSKRMSICPFTVR